MCLSVEANRIDIAYQIPLICEVRIGGVLVRLGSFGHSHVNGRQGFVAALEPTETYLLHGAVNLCDDNKKRKKKSGSVTHQQHV